MGACVGCYFIKRCAEHGEHGSHQINVFFGEHLNGMLMILGLNADSEVWKTDSDRLTTVVDVLIDELLKQRAAARDRHDYAAADAITDWNAFLLSTVRPRG